PNNILIFKVWRSSEMPIYKHRADSRASRFHLDKRKWHQT
ncbi:MAG: hypothetical protein ACJAYK_003020, partial [Crocinitomicaceae bacterium]